MERATILFSAIDPEVLQAQGKAYKLLQDFYACTDFSMKDRLQELFFNEIMRIRELNIKAPAREAVKNLHTAKYPVINLN